MKPGKGSALLLFAHGARDPAWADPFRAMAGRIRHNSPHLAVELAFLEFMTPTLADAVGRLATTAARVTVVPLFLAQGGHLREDLPRLLDDIRKRHPALRIDVAPAIGDSPELTALIADWALGEHLKRD